MAETIFFHFLRQQSTATSGSSLSFNQNIFETFLSVLSIVLFRVFFCKWKLLLKLRVSPFLKTNHIPASGHHFFQFFGEFLKWKQLFRIVETYPSPGQGIRIFCLVEAVFFGQCYFPDSRNHYQNKKNRVLRERAHYCQWATDFLASGNHFLSIFQRLLPENQFPLVKIWSFFKNCLS